VAATHVLYIHDYNMTSAQFKRWLGKQGCTFEPAKGGHLKVLLGKQASILPMHGASKEIGKGLENRIKKDLGLK
jgi:mRNA interferase HicA